MGKYDTKRNVFLGIGFILFINLIVFPFFPKLMIGRALLIGSLLDVKFGFTSDVTYILLLNLPEDARRVYVLSTPYY